MLSGKGDQYWMTKKYQSKRVKGLANRYNLTDEEIEKHDISGSQGYGRTDITTMEIDQHPYPMDQSIKAKKKVNLALEDPKMGNGG